MNNSLFSLIIEEHFEMPGVFALEFTRNVEKLIPNTMVKVLCLVNSLDRFHN